MPFLARQLGKSSCYEYEIWNLGTKVEPIDQRNKVEPKNQRTKVEPIDQGTKVAPRGNQLIKEPRLFPKFHKIYNLVPTILAPWHLHTLQEPTHQLTTITSLINLLWR